MRIKSTLSSFSILMLSFFIALPTPLRVVGQVDEKEKAQKELEKRQELERKTLALLDETVAAAWGLKLSENRSFVLTNAAELLWTRDEKRARNMFWEALNILNLTTTSAPEDSTAKGPTAKVATSDKIQVQNRYFATFAARREFLRKVARRDPQLALDMLRATRQPPPPLIDAARTSSGRSPTRRWSAIRNGPCKSLARALLRALLSS